MNNNVPNVAPPSHIPISTLWDRQKELFDNEQCASKLFSRRIHDKYYQAVKDGKDIKHLANGNERCFRILTPDNYRRPLEHLLKIEQARQVLENRRYDLPNVKVKLESDPEDESRQILLFHYTGLATTSLTICPGDQLVIKHPDSCYHIEKVFRVKGDLIRTDSIESQANCFSTKGSKFSIIFSPNGVPIYRCLQALTYFEQDPNGRRMFREMLFPEDNFDALKEKLRRTAPKVIIDDEKNNNLVDNNPSEMNQRLARCNDAQKSAITNILAGRCRPKPYILFGPPGTGKTFTLVESVIQLYLRRPDLHILVCVSSNVCANHVADLLDESGLFEPQTLYRLMPCQRLDDLSENLLMKEYHTDDAGIGRIIVTTNVKAGSIRRQFDYVFVDEAGHALEPEALIAATKLKPGGVFVLSGDPRQLRPVIKHSVTSIRKYCLNVSMLERLYKNKLYSEKKDKNYITILDESYRSDERLMKLWDSLFYAQDNLKLINKGPQTPQELLDLFDLKNNPIGFKNNLSEEAIITQTRSRWNEGEVQVCLELVRKLRKLVRPDQIGIISMYKLQVKMIQKALLDHLHELGRSRPQNSNNQEVGGDFIRYQRRRRNRRKKQQQQQQKQQIDKSPEQDWLDFEQMVVKMRQSRGRRRATTKNGLGNLPEPNQTTTTLDDLPLLVDTVDAFQGNEREVIIISTVRSPGIESFKFIHDPRRLNVAMSRAKWLLLVVGNKQVLSGGLHWRGFLEAAKNI